MESNDEKAHALNVSRVCVVICRFCCCCCCCYPFRCFALAAPLPAPPLAFSLVMGKVEGKGDQWHGHVTAVTVAPEYRRLGLAQNLMGYLERLSEQAYNGFFVDLYVRKGNALAVDMYKALGYIVYRQVIGYYTSSGPDHPAEDAFDMHKALPRDKDKRSMIPIPKPVMPGEQDMW